MSDSPSDHTALTVAEPSAALDIGAEQAVNLVDIAVVGVVVAVALGYLYRTLWARRGKCSGCADGKAGCAVQRGSATGKAVAAGSGTAPGTAAVQGPVSGRGKRRR